MNSPNGSPAIAQSGKKLPAMQETWQELQFPFPGQEDHQGWEDPLEKEIATHSSILAWKILWTAHGVSES